MKRIAWCRTGLEAYSLVPSRHSLKAGDQHLSPQGSLTTYSEVLLEVAGGAGGGAGVVAGAVAEGNLLLGRKKNWGKVS